MKSCKSDLSILNGLNGNGDRCDQAGKHDAAQKIEQSIGYMRQNLDKPLQVAALAAQVSISPSHYFALFKRCTGSAPIDYFTRLRMQRARDLLDGTELSVKEIATALGYEDPFYFSRVFKSVNHIAPSDYRTSHKVESRGIRNGSNGNGHSKGGAEYRNGGGLRLGYRFGIRANSSKSSTETELNEVRQGKAKI